VAARGQSDNDEDTTNVDFFGAPKDWIARFGGHFRVNQHTHLDQGAEAQEILPWLKLAADTNPQMIETYTVAAYWLRKNVRNPKEAEAFLREGLRNNPGNCEILFALGQIYNEDYHDTNRARNVWLAALQRWQAQNDMPKKTANGFATKYQSILLIWRKTPGIGRRPSSIWRQPNQCHPTRTPSKAN